MDPKTIKANITVLHHLRDDYLKSANDVLNDGNPTLAKRFEALAKQVDEEANVLASKYNIVV